jgi:hypothetical protein
MKALLFTFLIAHLSLAFAADTLPLQIALPQSSDLRSLKVAEPTKWPPALWWSTPAHILPLPWNSTVNVVIGGNYPHIPPYLWQSNPTPALGLQVGVIFKKQLPNGTVILLDRGQALDRPLNPARKELGLRHYTLHILRPGKPDLTVCTKETPDPEYVMYAGILPPYEAAFYSEWYHFVYCEGAELFVDTFRISQEDKVSLFITKLGSYASEQYVRSIRFQPDPKGLKLSYEARVGIEEEYKEQPNWLFSISDDYGIWKRMQKVEKTKQRPKIVSP